VIRYALLGLVQGLTEFLPVSSSGHLVLAERFLGLDPPGVLLEAMLHWGTLAAILIVFRGDLAALARSLRGRGDIEHRKEVGFLIAGSVPIVAIALLFRTTIESAFTSVLAVGIGLLFTAGALFTAHALRKRPEHALLRFPDAMAVGLAQAASVFPGVSRSGVTISMGSAMGLTTRQAARFSFLLAIPALFGSGLLHLLDVMRSPAGVDWPGIVLGTACAFLTGWLALHGILRLVQRNRLWIFAVYCLVVGGAATVGSWMM
jgi:undecaprenyl-diphosphatase